MKTLLTSAINDLKHTIPLNHPLRLTYHKIRAIFANIIYLFPSKNMIVIGVTGTNGKTTTCNIIAKGLQNAGKKVFMFSTVNIILNKKEYQNNTKMTSPDVFKLQKLLKTAKKEGCEIAIIETASHGIKMHRIWGIEYDFAILTNISQDHLDLHKTMEDYVNTKLTLFKNLTQSKRKKTIKKTAIINRETNYHTLFLSQTYDQLFTYGCCEKVNLQAQNIKKSDQGMTFDTLICGERIHISTPLKGDFNVYNILAAIGIFISFGFTKTQIQDTIKQISGIPGRMEAVKNDKGLKIFVDYAHTPDALEKVLQSIREIPEVKNIITVFGATGDRDKTKRPIMGKIVSQLSDSVIVTEEDDYTENIHEIIGDIISGIPKTSGQKLQIIHNRKEAIKTAIHNANKYDAILVAGKGDEHIMATNNGAVEWHDKTVIQQILKNDEKHSAGQKTNPKINNK